MTKNKKKKSGSGKSSAVQAHSPPSDSSNATQPVSASSGLTSVSTEPTRKPFDPIHWYSEGFKLPAEKIDALNLTSMVYETVAGQMPGYAPTTWEEWAEYIEKEKLKPKGSRKLLHVMCFILVIGIQGHGKVTVTSSEMKLKTTLGEGDAMILPAVDLPPNVFTADYRAHWKEDDIHSVSIDETIEHVTALQCYWVKAADHQLYNVKEKGMEGVNATIAEGSTYS